MLLVGKAVMKISASGVLLAVSLSTVCAAALAQTVTLSPPHDPTTKKYDEGKSCFSFKLGALKEVVLKQTKRNDWDLGYGFLSIGGQDWFRLHFASRSVIKDLGELKWDDPVTVPPLEPLPPPYQKTNQGKLPSILPATRTKSGQRPHGPLPRCFWAIFTLFTLRTTSMIFTCCFELKILSRTNIAPSPGGASPHRRCRQRSQTDGHILKNPNCPEGCEFPIPISD
jgi:hypothetical protein